MAEIKQSQTEKSAPKRVNQKERQADIIQRFDATSAFVHNSRSSRAMLRTMQNLDLYDYILRGELGYTVDMPHIEEWFQAIEEVKEKMAKAEQLAARLLVNSNNSTINRNKTLRKQIQRAKSELEAKDAAASSEEKAAPKELASASKA